MGNPEYSVVVPVYRGEPFLATLYGRLVATLGALGQDFEIVFVDDGSPDGSWSVLQDLRRKDSRVTLVQLCRNYGQHAATICGFSYCRGHYVITLDDDLQHPPEEIPRLIEELKKGFSLVYGKYLKKKHGWFRNLGSRLTNQVLGRVTSSQYDLTAFRIMEARIAKAIVDMGSPHCILDILAFHVIPPGGISYCTVRHEQRQGSNYRFMKLVSIAVDIVFNYSVFPLRVASVVGALTACAGLIIGGTYIVLYLLGRTDVSGFTTLVLLQIIFSGVIVSMLGIIGEYIGRMFLTLHKKPLYIVKQVLN